MQSPKRRVVAAAPALVGLAGLLVISVLLFAPVSDANRQTIQSVQTATRTRKRPRAEIVPGEILVRFKENKALEGPLQLTVPNKVRGPQRLNAAPEQIALRVDHFEGSNLVSGLRIAHTSAADTWKAIAALRARDDVLYAEPNYLRHADNTPNDPSFSSLYGMTKIAAPQAWDLTTGSNGIVVGVVDEGIQLDHTDLQANIWTNPSPGSIAGISGDLHGYDFIGNSGTIPPEGHATHVAGTIGAVGNNSTGVVGVNWQSSLMSLRFIDEATNSGSDADAIRALNYAKQMRDLWISSNHAQGANIRVLNNSYGGAGFSQAFLDAINAINQSDILFVAAAGNDGESNDFVPHYPANFAAPNMISVAATDSSDLLANFSDYGLHSVWLGAPGVSILSTVPNNSYGTKSGTSMATPHVAGAAALLLAANPNLNVGQLRSILAFNGDPVASLQGKTVTGRRLNVFKSLQALNENDTTPPGTVGSFQITSQSGRSINLSWTASGDDGATGQASLYDISFVDGSTSAVVPLTSMTPSVSGTAQTAIVNIPYRHTTGTIRLREFDNVGNEGTPSDIPVSVPLVIADPYVPNTTAAAALSTGGTAMAMNCDDCLKTRTLPFAFPFFGVNYSSIMVSSNGNIYFETTPGHDVPSSRGELAQFRMIAGMWDDLDLRTSRRANADVLVVQPDATHVIYRWQGVQFGDGVNGDPINFEIELTSDGTIKTRYGSGNTNLLPVVGISGGEPDTYVIDSLTSEQSRLSLTNAESAIFTPRVPGPACPTSFYVGDYGDASDAIPGDGVCATAGGVCTLRAAIEEANAFPSCGTIDINLSIPGQITLGTALPGINHSVKINGPGANVVTVQRSTVGGTPDFSIFNIQSGVTANISALTISGGNSIGHGGGIFNDGTLTLTNITVSSNTAATGLGGGIYSSGTLTLTNSTVSSNRSGLSGGGAFNNGGTLTLTNSTVIGNTAAYGGGIFNQGKLTLTSSTVSGNSAGSANLYYGGGIYTTGSSGASVTLTNSTVSNNSAGGGGGIGSFGPVTLINSTVSGNTANNGDGGGIANFNSSTTNIKNTLVADNTLGSAGSGPDLSGTFNSQDYNLIGNTSGAAFTGMTAHNIVNTSANLGPLQDNGGSTFTHALLVASPAINAGTDLTSLNGAIDNSETTINLVDASAFPVGIGFAIQIDNEQMIVTGKASNTLTVTRATNSTTAVAHSNGAGVNSAFDQRGSGYPRLMNAHVDIGAYESHNLQINSLADTDDGACTDIGTGNGCTLREAINAANAQAGPGLITLAPALTAIGPSTISLLSALPTLSSDITVAGPGANSLTIQRSTTGGTSQFRVFTIAPAENLGFKTVTISGLTIANGRTPDGGWTDVSDGGGILLYYGTLNLTGVVLSGNRTGNGKGSGISTACNGGRGGGIAVYGSGILTLTNSTISNNLTGTSSGAPSCSGGTGGGIWSRGIVTLINSTLSGNSTGMGSGGSADGGGVYNYFGGRSTLINVTVTNNRADNGGGGGMASSDAMNPIILGNTIVGNNSAAFGSDLKGIFNSQDFNLTEDTSGASFTGTTTHNITGQDPLIGPLQNNGGPTLTHALLPGSPAIDAGNSSLTTDQRGQPRPIDDPLVANAAGGNGSDIGAYESRNIQVNSLADTDDGSCTDVGTGNGCTLREAINFANPQLAGDVITFAPALTAGGPATITLTSGDLVIIKSLTIQGPGRDLLTISGSNLGRVFNVSFGTVSILNLTIANGRVPGTAHGGGLVNSGILTLNNIMLRNSSAGSGGGISNNSSGTLTMTNSTVSANNSLLDAGGIYNFGALSVTNSTVSANSAAGSGGGLFNGGTLNLINSTISGDTAAGLGGGIYNIGTTISTNSTIANNRCDSDNTGGSGELGGGIYFSGDIFTGAATTLTNTIIAGNFRGTGATRDDVRGAFDPVSSYDLIGDGTNLTGISNGSNGNQVGSSGSPIDAKLGPLANNGGPTLTHALLTGSPAIDSGNNSAVNQLSNDQRGFKRIADGDGNGSATVDIGAYELQGTLIIDAAIPPACRTSGGQQIRFVGSFPNLSSVLIGPDSVPWFYTNGPADTSSITVTTPAHAVGAPDATVVQASSFAYPRPNALAYLPTVFTDDTILVGQTTAKAQHIIELRQAVDALRAVAGLGPAPWTDPALAPGGLIKATHIIELRMYLDDAATRLGYSTLPYADPGLTSGFMIKRIHIEELRQRIRTIAG